MLLVCQTCSQLFPSMLLPFVFRTVYCNRSFIIIACNRRLRLQAQILLHSFKAMSWMPLPGCHPSWYLSDLLTARGKSWTGASQSWPDAGPSGKAERRTWHSAKCRVHSQGSPRPLCSVLASQEALELVKTMPPRAERGWEPGAN